MKHICNNIIATGLKWPTIYLFATYQQIEKGYMSERGHGPMQWSDGQGRRMVCEDVHATLLIT